MILKNDEYFMQRALKEAKKASENDEVPVGCVIVYNNCIIAKAHNQRKKLNSPLGHAEIIAIQKAAKKLNSWILEDCTIYITLEPCIMCMGTILQSRISRIVYGADEPKFGALGSLIDLSTLKSNHHIIVSKNLFSNESAVLLKDFFKKIRLKNKS